MKTRSQEIIAALEADLAERVGDSRYQLWFAKKTRFRLEGQTLTVGVANLFSQEWLTKTFGSAVQASAAALLGDGAKVEFVIDPQLFQAAREREAETTAAPKTPPHQGQAGAPRPLAPRKAPGRQRQWRQLEDFVVGPCNRVAHASAVSLIEEPDDHPKSLVFHGPVGTGKTHLLEAIYAGTLARRPDARVLFVTAEEFTNRFVQAMYQQKINSFRKHFRECDLLLIDDVHFLAKKQATQEEFLHTVDALQTDGCAIAVSCDCHPRLADHFLPELTDRLVGGAVWGLTPPDRATRLNLLRARALRGARVPEAVLAFLADHLHGNFRELEGALHSVLHLAKVTQRPVDLELAREALGDLLRHSVRMVRLADVERAVCEVLGLPGDALRSKKRGWSTSHPRMLAMYLARKHTNSTYTEIGKQFGDRNHSTVVASEKKVRQWLADNARLPLGKRELPVRDLVQRIELVLWQ